METLGRPEGTPMTATEVSERMADLSRQIGSSFGRLQSELIHPLLKRIIVKLVSFTLDILTNLPTKDATNGFRLFSEEIVDKFKIESKEGFTFSIELLAKSHRHNYRITELPEQWPVRNYGKSKFKYSSIFFYIKWYFYILITSFKNAKKN